MKNLRLLSKLLAFLIFYSIATNLFANEPVDIWKIEKIITSDQNNSQNENNIKEEKIFGVKIESENKNIIVD